MIPIAILILSLRMIQNIREWEDLQDDAEIIKEIRNTEKNVLILDAGDIFQGTPYFNMYRWRT